MLSAIRRPFTSSTSVIFGWLNQLTCLQRHDCKATQKDDCNENEECGSEIADLQLPEHESDESWHQNQHRPLTLSRLVRCQNSQNNPCHGHPDGKHHNRLDHAASLGLLTLLRTARGPAPFSATCPEEADRPWGCQVDAAEQRVGFFNQELRLITHQ